MLGENGPTGLGLTVNDVSRRNGHFRFTVRDTWLDEETFAAIRVWFVAEAKKYSPVTVYPGREILPKMERDPEGVWRFGFHREHHAEFAVVFKLMWCDQP